MNISFINLENFFVLPQAPSKDSSAPPKAKNPNTPPLVTLKDKEKVKLMAHNMKEIDSDIFVLSEVGGIDSLREFNKKYFKNKYHPSLIEGNSDRGIELGFLIKKDLPFRYEHFTHRNRSIKFNYNFELKENRVCQARGLPLKHEPHFFSRDIAELRILKKNETVPSLIILAVHLKSQHDKENIDPRGFERRRAELHTLVDTYNILDKRYKGDVPIIICGDFNGNAQKLNCDEEFRYLYEQTALRDILEVVGHPDEMTKTCLYFDKDKNPAHTQFDYIFIPPRLFEDINYGRTGVFQYIGYEGMPFKVPQTSLEATALPSDHYPIVIDFNLPD